MKNVTISVEVDPVSHVAVVRCPGPLMRADATEAAERLWSTEGWDGDSAVWDFREAQFKLSASDVQFVARFILRNQPATPPSRMAFVTPGDANFGLARMFAVYREQPKTDFRVFRELPDAISWAGAPGVDAT